MPPKKQMINQIKTVRYRTDINDPKSERRLIFSELAKISGLTSQTIRVKWKNAGRPEPLHKEHPVMMRVARKHENLTLNGRRATPKDIAIEVGVPEYTVWFRIRKYGHKLKTRHFDDYFQHKQQKEDEKNHPTARSTEANGRKIQYVTKAEREKLDKIPSPTPYEREYLS